MTDDKMPPLPEAFYPDDMSGACYSDDDMKAYARAYAEQQTEKFEQARRLYRETLNRAVKAEQRTAELREQLMMRNDELVGATHRIAELHQQTAKLRAMLLEKPTGTGWSRVLEMEQQTEELQDELDKFRNGYKGACYACEPVGMKNVELRNRIVELESELDNTGEHGKYCWVPPGLR